MQQTFFKKIIVIRVLILPLTFFCLINFLCGQSARAEILFDNSYAPTLTRLNDGPASILLLSDEKFLAIRLANQNILGTQQYKVTRFNADGSIDRIFDSAVMARGDGTLLMQSDGKILVLGSNIFVNGENRGGIVRLNADGTFDSSFNASWALEAIGGVIQPDGRILVGVASTNEQVLNKLHKVTRLNSDGSLDLTFSNNAAGIPLSSNPSGVPLAVQPDGKILISKGSNSSQRMERLNADGTIDQAFTNNLPSANSSLPNPYALTQVTSIIVLPDNKILIGGRGIIRLNNDGTQDASFDPGSAYQVNYMVYRLVRQPDGKIIIGGIPSAFYGSTITRKRLTRINDDGTQDNTFDAMTSEEAGSDLVIPLILRPNGTILASFRNLSQNNAELSSLISLNPNGSVDETFSADFGKISGEATLVVNQQDGKMLVAGTFTEANNFPTFGLARLNLNGTTDTSFYFSNQITGDISALVIQTDGKILIGGNFRYNNQSYIGVFRLNQNGSIDSGFTLNVMESRNSGYDYPSVVRALAIQTDGKILAGGDFKNYGNSGRDGFVRLNTNGTIDTSYNVEGSTNNSVYKMLVQPDGKIIVQGNLIYMDSGATRTNPRLNTEGHFDWDFVLPWEVGNVFAVALDGKLASGGLKGAENSRLEVHRLNSNGSRDASFAFSVTYSGGSDVVFQPDGRMIVGHGKTIFRLNLNGSIESRFDSTNYLNIRKLLISADNKLIVIGRFTNINGIPRNGIARFFINDAGFRSIDGTVTYGNTPANQVPKFVSGVLMSATGTTSTSITTYSTGAYLLSNLVQGGSYTVSPSKTGNVNGISPFDATLVLRHVAANGQGANALTVNQQKAADTNGDGNITPFDATLILRYIAAGAPNANTGQVGNWKFDPASLPYPNITTNLANQNYTAFLIGEVNGDWTLPIYSFNANPATLGSIPDGTGASPNCQVPGPPRNVTFDVNGLTKELQDISVTITFNPQHTWSGDILATLISPDGSRQFDLFGYTGATTATGGGDGSHLLGPYTFTDAATQSWWTTAQATADNAPIPAGNYRTSNRGGAGSTGGNTSINAAFGGMSPAQANGTWTLRLTDGCNVDSGSISAAGLNVTTN